MESDLSLSRGGSPVVPGASRPVIIAAEDPAQPDILALLATADAYYRALYPPESNHLLDVEALRGSDVRFLVARAGGRALGTGALAWRGAFVEIKRMWVDPAARELGLGRRMLGALETLARAEGAAVLHLETGVRQPAALALYRSAGFAQTGPFGDYHPDPLSLFFVKALA